MFFQNPLCILPANHPTFLGDGVFVLGVHKWVLDGTTSSEMYLNTMFSADVIAALTESFNLGCHYVGHLVAGSCVVSGVGGTLVGSFGFLVFDISPIQSPYRVIVSLQCLFELVFFLLKQLGIEADSLCSVFEV